MIYQVHFNDETKAACDPAWTPYDNSEKLTEFFENEVIRELIRAGHHNTDKYFGVFSHDVNQSVNFKEEGLVFNPLNLDKIINKHDCDVYSFQKRRHNANIATQAERYHPGFLKIMNELLNGLGVELPRKLNKIVLFNLMVAKSHFWEAYFKDFLAPAMEILVNMPSAYEDSGYALIGRPMNKEKAERFKKAFGREHYPFHPFICERLASIYLQLHPEYSFKQIF